MKKFMFLFIIIFTLSGFSFNVIALEKTDSKSNKYSYIGIYTGMIDDNSVEIKINNTAMAFRLTYKTSQYLSDNMINENNIVRISYYKNEYNQLVLQNIKKIKIPSFLKMMVS